MKPLLITNVLGILLITSGMVWGIVSSIAFLEAGDALTERKFDYNFLWLVFGGFAFFLLNLKIKFKKIMRPL